jgi:hypothetical protein
MARFALTKTRLVAGIWEGVLTRDGSGTDAPALRVTHEGKPIEGVEITALADPGVWAVRIPVPAGAISDGVQTFLITDAATGEELDHFALIAGEALADDIRAEVDLLRAELDMLKRAFRRHCLETT